MNQEIPQLKNSQPWLRQNRKLLLHFSLCILWFFSLSRPGKEFKYSEHSKAQLNEIKDESLNFIKLFKRTPVSLRELYIYSSDHGLFSLYDTLGQRLDYLSLSNNHFLLRNFGLDGLRNSLSLPADFYSGNLSFSGKRYFSTSEPLNPFWFFPIPLTATQVIPGKIQGKIFVNQLQKTRFLVVQSVASNNESRILIAPHDQVEQFILFDKGNKILYAATGSDRYSDGLYLWDLRDNQTINLINTKAYQHNFNTTSLPWIIQLVGIDAKNNVISAYTSQETQLIQNNPLDLYQTQNLFHWNLNSLKLVNLDPENQNSPLNSHVELQNLSSLLIKANSNILWRNLFDLQDLEASLSNWTQFCQATGQDELLHYHCLFLLSVLYYESSQSATLQNSPEEKDRLRAYAAQLAYQLAQASGVPLFLRLLGNDQYRRLMNNLPMEIRYFPVLKK